MAFAHLHVHSCYSLLDGVARIKELINRACLLGQNAMALTDHGVMHGVIEFYEYAKLQKIKPILGCEVYYTSDMTQKIHGIDNKRFHLTLLAKNNIGYQNLIKIVSLGYTKGFYYKPRVDFKTLSEFKNGLIVLSGCQFGEISKNLVDDKYKNAKEIVLNFKDVFKDNYYIEIQNFGTQNDRLLNQEFAKLSKDTDTEMVATNDVHYAKKEDWFSQDILLCIGTNKKLDDENRLNFKTDQLYVKSEKEMLENFVGFEKTLQNTENIATKCNLELEFGQPKLPKYKVINFDNLNQEEINSSSFEILKNLCNIGFSKNYKTKECDVEYLKKAKKRLEYELSVIKKMDFADYFLIVWDFIKFAKENGIAVGPGRGSVGGSVVAYCLFIITIDPLKYDLIFERFLNEERISMPDIDIDFCYTRREEVINYVTQKYGQNHVAKIITFGTMAARQAIKDVGRVMGCSYSYVEYLSKQIPITLDITINEALKNSKTLKDLYKNDEKARTIIDNAIKIEGLPRHTSIHAAGLVITEKEVTEYIPLKKSKDLIMTQYDMRIIEKLGILKIDFLGLRTLSNIESTLSQIKINENIDINIEKINQEDKNVYEMISKGEVCGLFQLEGNRPKINFLKKFRPSRFSDLAAAISLYRPGPMQSVDRYIKNKNSNEIDYKHPILKEILKNTYGCILYQEQVMKIVQKIAGFSLAEADLIRKSISKKDAEIMGMVKERFLNGATHFSENGQEVAHIDEKTAKEIFDEIVEFSKYAFNKSHAVAYSKIAYQTAWLKYYYPKYFFASLLSNMNNKDEQIMEFNEECIRLRIKILPPSINESEKNFKANKNGIIYGLSAIKHIGEGFSKAIVNEREKFGPYLSFEDFCLRMNDKGLNKKNLEWLIKSGSFDCFEDGRKTLLEDYENVLKISTKNKQSSYGQIDMFTSENPSKEETFLEYSLEELLNMEKEALGIYLSDHVLGRYLNLAKFYNTTSILNLKMSFETKKEKQEKIDVNILGIIIQNRIKKTKNNQYMAFLKIEDMSSHINVTVFAKEFEKYENILSKENIVIMNLEIDINKQSDFNAICKNVKLPDEFEFAKNKLYLQFKTFDKYKLDLVKKMISDFQGNTPIYVYYKDKKQTFLISKKYWITPNEALMNGLSKFLGDKNVKLIEKDN